MKKEKIEIKVDFTGNMFVAHIPASCHVIGASTKKDLEEEMQKALCILKEKGLDFEEIVFVYPEFYS